METGAYLLWLLFDPNILVSLSPPLPSSQSKRFLSSSHKTKGMCKSVRLSLYPLHTKLRHKNGVCVLSHRYPRKHPLIAGECWLDAQSICGFEWARGCAESGGHWPRRSRALWRTMQRPGTKWALEKSERESEEEKRRGMGRGAGV